MLVICVSVHLSVIHLSMFLFLDDNLSKYYSIFTKLGMCIDIVEIWIGIANGQISSILTVASAQSGRVLLFHNFIYRYNKCCLDEINDTGICTKSVEEVHNFTLVSSPPLGNSLIKAVAIGTSHMAAVTGNGKHCCAGLRGSVGSASDW